MSFAADVALIIAILFCGTVWTARFVLAPSAPHATQEDMVRGHVSK